MMKFGILVFLAIFPFLHAQEIIPDSIKSKNIEEIFVTGTRTERSTASLPIPTQIISGESIRKSGVSRLNEIIQEQTGLITVPDFGGVEGVQIQGLDAAYVMILIDGQPLFGRTAGTLDLSRISVNNIEKIEIVKGASSSLYGSEALAGVINIITKKTISSEKTKGNFNYKIASFGIHDASVLIETGKKKTRLEFFGNYFKTNGYNLSKSDFSKTVEPYYNFTFQPKLFINFSDKVNLSFNTRFFNQNQNNKAEIGSEKYNGDSKINEWNSALLLNHTITEKLKIIYDLYATNYKTYEFLIDKNEKLFSESRFNQWFYRPEIRTHYKIGKNTFTAGIGMTRESLDRTYFDGKAKLNSEYFFGQMEWFIKNRWNFLTGFRYDLHHQYQSQFSPKIGINYTVNKDFSLKTSLGYGYKAPDLRQLYFDFTNSAVGYTVLGYAVAEKKLKSMQDQILTDYGFNFSEPLKPESSVNLNLGGVYKKNKFSFDFNFFYNSIKNLIDSRAIAQKKNGQNIFSYFNIDKVFTYGFEFNSNYKIGTNFNFSVGYQYLIAKDQSVVEKFKNGEYARDPVTLESFKLNTNDYFGLYNRSNHMANIKINYNLHSLKSSIFVRVFYRSKFGIYDTNGNNFLDRYDNFAKGYFTTNLTIIKNFKYGFSSQLGVINIFNYKDAGNITNLPGSQLFAKVQYQF